MDRRELLKGLAVTLVRSASRGRSGGRAGDKRNHSAYARTYAPACTGPCAPEICRRYLAGQEKAPCHC